jgi:hypothetical protein
MELELYPVQVRRLYELRITGSGCSGCRRAATRRNLVQRLVRVDKHIWVMELALG